MTHRVTFTSKYGAHQVGRVYNAPDRDSAAIFISAKYPGAEIKTVEAISEGAARLWGEHDLGQFTR